MFWESNRVVVVVPDYLGIVVLFVAIVDRLIVEECTIDISPVVVVVSIWIVVRVRQHLAAISECPRHRVIKLYFKGVLVQNSQVRININSRVYFYHWISNVHLE